MEGPRPRYWRPRSLIHSSRAVPRLRVFDSRAESAIAPLRRQRSLRRSKRGALSSQEGRASRQMMECSARVWAIPIKRQHHCQWRHNRWRRCPPRHIRPLLCHRRSHHQHRHPLCHRNHPHMLLERAKPPMCRCWGTRPLLRMRPLCHLCQCQLCRCRLSTCHVRLAHSRPRRYITSLTHPR